MSGSKRSNSSSPSYPTSRSFVHFAPTPPCWYLAEDGNSHTPQFSSAIAVLTDTDRSGSYSTWAVNLLGMTLLEPLAPSPSYVSADGPDWRRIPVNIPPSGLRTVFDSGTQFRPYILSLVVTSRILASMNSTFPNHVVDDIAKLWFDAPAGIDYNAPLEHHNARNFEGYDIIFFFESNLGPAFPVEFRCPANTFLGGLWNERSQGRRVRWSNIRPAGAGAEGDFAVLGMVSLPHLSLPYRGIDASSLTKPLCRTSFGAPS